MYVDTDLLTKLAARLCAVKLDMHRAYDRVEWCFLEGIMLRMGFDVRWVQLMMACVKSVTYSVRFNSRITERFIPSRGLRQGDPLSPYLCLLVAEGLSALLLDAEERGVIEGVKVCRDAPSVSHLLFADDSLILMKADVANANTLKGILQSYCNASDRSWELCWHEHFHQQGKMCFCAKECN